MGRGKSTRRESGPLPDRAGEQSESYCHGKSRRLAGESPGNDCRSGDASGASLYRKVLGRAQQIQSSWTSGGRNRQRRAIQIHAEIGAITRGRTSSSGGGRSGRKP